MSRRKVSLVVLSLVAAGLFVFVPSVCFTVFAGLLVAVLLRGVGGWLARPLGLGTGWGISILLVLILVLACLGTLGFAANVIDQFDELWMKLPQAFSQFRDRFDDYDWVRRFVDHLSPRGLLSNGGGSAASIAISSTFGALGSFVVIAVVGLYGAFDPRPYKHGLLLVMAPSIRGRAETVIEHVVDTLRHWLTARIISMTVVGVLTGIGLWLIGLPLAFILGIIAGLLAFIPNIGPIISVVPALLLAFVAGWHMVVWVLAVYLIVQTLESYLITPLVQQREISVPPAFVISMQLLFGVLFGILGLALAMPLAAIAITLISELYVSDYLEHEDPEKV